MPICLNWQCWTNISSTITYGGSTANSSSDIQTTDLITATDTISSSDSLLQSTIKDLQDENFRIKLGLSIGLGAPLVIVSTGAIGMYIYFTSQ
jgi:hypothetical protein